MRRVGAIVADLLRSRRLTLAANCRFCVVASPFIIPVTLSSLKVKAKGSENKKGEGGERKEGEGRCRPARCCQLL